MRTIAVGGVGHNIVVDANADGEYVSAWLTSRGYIGFKGSEVIAGQDAYVANGDLVLKTTSTLFNKLGVTYRATKL